MRNEGNHRVFFSFSATVVIALLTHALRLQGNEAFQPSNLQFPFKVSTIMASKKDWCVLQHHKINLSNKEMGGKEYETQHPLPTRNTFSSRREALATTSNVLGLIPLVLMGQPAVAANDALDTLTEAARRFRGVPTFAIVDGEKGTPFMILQNDGVATGYFFTSFDGATQVLDDARRDSAEKKMETADTWARARISAIPLDFALKLSKARPKSTAQNGNKYATVYDFIPSSLDMDDATSIDTSGIFTERGRVPLFYFENLVINNEGGDKRFPVYLQKTDLFKEWKKQFPEERPPPLKVLDLVDTFNAMLRPGSKDERFNNLILIPPQESRKAANECEKSRGTASPYQMGQMIAVGGK